MQFLTSDLRYGWRRYSIEFEGEFYTWEFKKKGQLNKRKKDLPFYQPTPTL